MNKLYNYLNKNLPKNYYVHEKDEGKDCSTITISSLETNEVVASFFARSDVPEYVLDMIISDVIKEGTPTIN